MIFNPDTFELFLFTTDPQLAKECNSAGVNAIIIDWENKDKEKRQNGYSTQINYDTADDLVLMRNNFPGTIICRINKYNPLYAEDEINQAIDGGADELLLPMVENKEEVNHVLKIVNNRCKVGILIETDAAVNNAASFTDLPLSRIYIGLNDLHISRKSVNIFEPLVDTTVEKIKSLFPHIPVGVGGLTHPEKGDPIPSSILLKQYAALNINFSFLRRSFIKDIAETGVDTTVHAIKEGLFKADSISNEEKNLVSEKLKSYIFSTTDA